MGLYAPPAPRLRRPPLLLPGARSTFWDEPRPQRRRPLGPLTAVQRPGWRPGLVRSRPSQASAAPHPAVPRRMRARQPGVGQRLTAGSAVVARRALAGRFRGSPAALAALGGRTRGTRHAVGPAPRADGLSARPILPETLAMDLPHWPPVRGWALRGHP